MLTEEYEHVRELIITRNEARGDAELIVIAAVLAGRPGEIARSYVFEKLHMIATMRSSPGESYPENLLDLLAIRRFRVAVEEHADNPIQWLAESSGNSSK